MPLQKDAPFVPPLLSLRQFPNSCGQSSGGKAFWGLFLGAGILTPRKQDLDQSQGQQMQGAEFSGAFLWWHSRPSQTEP